MANPFKQLFPDSKCIDAIQIRVPHEVYRTIAQDAHIQNTSISEILMALIKERYFQEEKKCKHIEISQEQENWYLERKNTLENGEYKG